jgi:hypothetical protein
LLRYLDLLTLCADPRCERLVRVERLIDALIEVTGSKLGVGAVLGDLSDLGVVARPQCAALIVALAATEAHHCSRLCRLRHKPIFADA